VERVRAEISETDQLRKPEFKFDLRIATPQGEDRWLAVRERRSYDSEGNPVRSFGVCWDKTQEKQMELGLRASEERLRAFHENVAVGLIEIDLKNFRYLNANRAFCEMFGYEEKELLRMGPLDLAGPRDVDVIRQSLEDIASERKTVHKAERQYRRRSGELLWVQIVASAIRDEAGRPVRLACIIQDISERKKIEQALRESDQRYQLATALTGITVFEIDLESRMAYSSDFKNEPFNAPNGVLPLEKVYEKVHFEDRFPGNQVEHWQSARKDEIFVNESRVIVPGGGYRWNSSRARVIFDDNGKAVRVLGVSMDITRQKQLLHDLQAAKEQAERASNAKSEFIANMSHEIRTPMNAILGYADLLKDEQLRLKDIESYIERIRHNGKQLLRIIDDVLDFSRLEAGRVAVEPMPVQVLSLVSEAMESLRSLAEAKKLAFTLEQASAIPMVLTTDPFRLKQILTNVIGNAIKFTARGFVRVKLASDEPAQGSLIIDVEDSGIGIDQEKRSRLFHAFSQGDSSVTRVFGGTGLGLLLAKRFAQALGGDLILAASEPRQGSTFRITVKSLILPVMDHVEPSQTETAATVNRETDTATKPAKSTAASLEGLRILVVEDSAENAALIRIYLKGQGAVLEFAQDGVEAIEMASQGEHDVVLMDIQMPRLDGLEATRELIRKGYHQPIVALTAHAMPDQIQRSLDAGCVAHLTKPIQREDLIAAIRRIVDSTRGALSSGT
jgi:PAS domain S-box-containing protein